MSERASSPSNDPQRWIDPDQFIEPDKDKERRIVLRRADWSRLTRKVGTVVLPVPKLQVAYCILIGAAVTAGSSIVPIYFSSGLPSWVTRLYVCSSLLLGFVARLLIGLHWGYHSKKKSEVKDVKLDMQEIEDQFPEGTF